MNELVLKRTQLWTLAAAVGLSLILWFTVTPRFALGTLLTALWAVAGFRALEGLIRAALLPRGTRRDVRGILIWAAAKLAVYGLAIWAVLKSPFAATSHLIGFSLLLVVLVVVGIVSLPRGANQPVQRGDSS